MPGIIEAALNSFECPVCKNYIAPPVRQCILGHVVCNNCFNQVKHCPTCRSPKNDQPAIHYDNFYKLLPFPCKYKDDGCKVIRRGEDILRHQKRCKFAQRTCPLSIFLDCDWNGSERESFVHCLKTHPEHTQFGPTVEFDIVGYDEVTKQTDYFILYNRLGRNYILACRVFKNLDMHWRLIQLGPPELPPSYCVLMNSFGKPVAKIRSTVLSPKEDIDTVFHYEKCETNDVKTAKEFFEDEGEPWKKNFFTNLLKNITTNMSESTLRLEEESPSTE